MSGARPIIIRRKKIVHGHHGGSWKIALADFMTALMALFLVMWILSAASQEERLAVAEYFSTPLVVALAGGDKSAASNSAIPGGGPDPVRKEGETARIDMRTQTRPTDEQRRFFMDLQRRIEEVIDADPLLKSLRSQLRFDLIQDGLRIQVLDTEQKPMFNLGSDVVLPYMRDLLRAMAPLLNELPNELSISGYTDSLQYAGGTQGYSNWELSVERANASRRELVAGGLDPDKLLRVAGFADRAPMPETQPNDPLNRRIELLVFFPEVAENVRHPTVLAGQLGSPTPTSARQQQGEQGKPVDQFLQGIQKTLRSE
ncbi:flagellar motor protein MotB [Porticoccus sp.]